MKTKMALMTNATSAGNPALSLICRQSTTGGSSSASAVSHIIAKKTISIPLQQAPRLIRQQDALGTKAFPDRKKSRKYMHQG
jgi:hypothetical protein